MFDSEIYDFLRKFKMPLKLGVSEEVSIGFEANIVKGGTIRMVVDDVINGCFHGVSGVIHDYCMK